MRSSLTPPFLAFLAAVSSGCLIEGDQPAGRMSVRLHFDEFSGSPEKVEWLLYEVSAERELAMNAECEFVEEREVVVCTNLDPGLYELAVEAHAGQRSWSRRCLGLVLDRFEERYECEVDLDPDPADRNADNIEGGLAGSLGSDGS